MGRRRIAITLFALLATGGTVGSPNADADASNNDTSTQASPRPRARRSRIRKQCAPELGFIKEESESAVDYARHSRTLCNTSSPWAEENANVPEVLGFVAPWIDHSYRAAKYFRKKFSSISPLWFRILPSRDESSVYEIAGLEIADEQKHWQRRVTKGEVDLLPHFSMEGFQNMSTLKALLESPRELAAEIAVFCAQRNFHGIVFDLRAALFRSFKPFIPRLTKSLGLALRGGGRRLFLSVPAARGPDFNAQDAASVAEYVDGIIVGTRDYSKQEFGPSAPIQFVEDSLTRLLSSDGVATGIKPQQLVMEIPLYGRLFPEGKEDGGKVIMTLEIAKLLAKQRPKLVWDRETREHSTNIKSKGQKMGLSFPTLAFIAERLKLAQRLGVGVAFRDLGAGLDYAFDLLPLRSAGEWDDDEEDNVTDTVATSTDDRADEPGTAATAKRPEL